MLLLTDTAMAATSEPEGPKDPRDPKAFYGYLYGEDKAPTKVFDALLRALAQYIVLLPLVSRGLLPRPRLEPGAD